MVVFESASECATASAAISHCIRSGGAWQDERGHQNDLTADGAAHLGFMYALICCFN